MKQASGLLGTRGCPGLTISKPKKLKVRSNAARKKKAENKFHPFDTVQQLKHPPKPTLNTAFTSLETVLQHLPLSSLFLWKQMNTWSTRSCSSANSRRTAKLQDKYKAFNAHEASGWRLTPTGDPWALGLTWGQKSSVNTENLLFLLQLKGELQWQTQNQAGVFSG